MITFQELYRTYAGEVFRFAYWLAGDRHDAEDITSETFVRAWTSKTEIRTQTVKAYLFTIARNTYLEQKRKKRDQIELEPNLADPALDPHDLTVLRLDLADVLRVIGDLPESSRSAFLLRVQHDLSYAEIARVLDISLSAAKVKVHRARLKLAAVRRT